MKTIVVFYPYNNLAIDQLSILEFLNKKFNVILLTIDTRGDLHRAANKIKIENLSIFENKGKLYKLINKKIFLVSKFLFYFYLLYKFPIIIKKRKVNFVFAHLEIAGLISSIYENILNFKSFYFRHSADANFVEGNFKSKILHKVINFLSKNIVCVSSAVKDQLIRKEKVNPKKIIQINYSYNFKLFNQFKSSAEKKTIFNKKKINLITIGRLVDLKRHILIFKLMLKLNKSKKKYNLFCLGTGVNQSKLKKFIKVNNVKNIFMIGYKKNVFDYIKKSNILIHFSESESFGHVILEAALAKKNCYSV